MKTMTLALLASTALAALPTMAATPADVVANYADIGAAGYADSLTAAQALDVAVKALVADSSETTLQAARTAWLASRVPYMQTEAFRFGNPIVDDWEGRVNAWPLDEGLIDYVDQGFVAGENPLATLNVIANASFELSGETVDAATITPALIADSLQEAGGIEANVASGYHAVEFLLWGQDLNGTGPGAGVRPWTDYARDAGCTGGHCDRRAEYLTAASDLLVADLEEMAIAWAPGGAAREAVTTDPQTGLRAMLTGMGSLSYGELAGQRMRLGLMLNDPEEEHDCFSDNTHNSHYYDGIGIRNVYLGRYERPDGSVVEGPSLADLVAAADAGVDAQLRAELDASVTALGAVKAAGDRGFTYDQMIAPGSAEGETLIMTAVDALVTQTGSIERAVGALGLEALTVEGSDSLDSPDAVFQ